MCGDAHRDPPGKFAKAVVAALDGRIVYAGPRQAMPAFEPEKAMA
jgi:hypothetical protein